MILKQKEIFKLLLIVIVKLLLFIETSNVFAYEVLRDIDKGTFNEYRYYIVKDFFKLKEHFQINNEIPKDIANSILKNAQIGYKYLPNNLKNENYLNNLSIAIKKGIEYPKSDINYENIGDRIGKFLEETYFESLKGNIEVFPNSGNAPLNVTLRGRITDPSGTIIPTNNYIWWIDVGGKKQIIGRGPSINYTFKDEGNFTVFLDVKSNHKNEGGYTDVLPFSSSTTIEVKEKIASLIININSTPLKDLDEIKFTPEEANYGLIIDATSSTPSSGAKFLRTEWDFGNGLIKKYDGSPKLERVIYGREGRFEVKLKLTTNEGKTVERKFYLLINKPVASIVSNLENGFIGDKFNFSTHSLINDKNLDISWKIIDINNDKVLLEKTGNILTHIFSDKGKYNIQLQVKDSQGNIDNDSKIIYINSRPPIADFTISIPETSKPNRVLLDGTKSFDPDFSDVQKLKYVWTINGEIVTLENGNSNNSFGYYTFDSLGDQNIILEVIDPDEIKSIKTLKINIKSLLSVDFNAFPRVIQRGQNMRFVASSPLARYYEWDFGDKTSIMSGNDSIISHLFEKSGIFNVKLKVRDISGNTNEITKVVYVGKGNSPVAIIEPNFGNNEKPLFDNKACKNGAYIIDRTRSVYFDGSESMNIDGTDVGLEYSWKIGNNKYLQGKQVNHKFDELGCYPIKLTVNSLSNKTQDSREIWVKVENIKPRITSLNISVQNPDGDPVIVNLDALGAVDPDGIIQSYLWYYYTDSDNTPQDFRITNKPNTTFVLPKITDTFYFVVVMKDNNDERYSTDENESSKYSLSLAGDNINTPLIDFSVNKNNILLGDEVIFNTKVKNILGQDISKDCEFAFDFDGDGFYDIERNKDGNINYIYKKSGEFFAKVRVKHKGITNVRKIQMNVENVLTPDFDYISIGNKYLFINKTKGSFDSLIWDLGGIETIKDKNYFIYEFKNGKSINTVNLKTTEGTKVESIKKDVIKNMKNVLLSKQNKGINVFSIPEIKDNKIILEDKEEKVYIYLGETNVSNLAKYGIDFDISTDSDLNGGKDDDIDNKNHPSFNDGSIVEIILNSNKNQTFRIFLLDQNENIIENKDIEIIKSYIEENEEINSENIIFNGISENEQIKIEKLKSYIQNLPKEYRLKGMQFIQKLQEEWFYKAEKTKTIIDFVEFIMQTNDPSSKEIRDLLESFLIEGQEDTSVRNMAYNVVKNLLPKELAGYNELIGNLDLIKNSPENIEENKILGKEILESIKESSLITNDDKITIKSQLQVMIYGSVENIPQEIKNEIKKTSENKLFGLIINVLSLFKWIIIIIIGIITIFFILYKLLNKNKNLGFQDFIIEFTSGKEGYKKTTKIVNENNNIDDILQNIQEEKKDEEHKNKEDKITIENDANTQNDKIKIPDFLLKAQNAVENEEEKIVKNEKEKIKDNSENNENNDLEEKNIEINEINTENNEIKIPDFLKSSFDLKQQKTESKQDKQQKETEIPDWLKNDNPKEEKIKDNSENKKEKKLKKEDKKIKEKEIITKKEDNNKETNSFGEKIKKEEDIEIEEENIKIEEEKIPDWLKGSFNLEQKTESKQDKQQKETEIPDWLKNDNPKEEKIKDNSENNRNNDLEEKNIEINEINKENNEIKIPDFSKGSFDLEQQKTENKQDKQQKETEIPDWLKNDNPKEEKIRDNSENKNNENLGNNQVDSPDNKKDDFWSLDQINNDDDKK